MFKNGEFSNLKPKNWSIGFFWISMYALTLVNGPKWGVIPFILWVPYFFVFFGSFLKTRRFECFFFSLGIVVYNWYSAWMVSQADSPAFLIVLYGLILPYAFWKQWQFPGSDLPFRYFRDILELAAKPVVGMADGYTGRPYPAGMAEYSKEELVGFAKYLQKRFIATSYVDEEGVKLVFSNGLFQYLPFWKPNWRKVTYMTFNYRGNYSVFFSKKHYHQYIVDITFDQLCNEFGHVIVQLLEDYKKGDKHKILDRIRGREILSDDDLEKRGSAISGWLSDIRRNRKRKKEIAREK